MSKILIDEATVKLALDHSEPSILSPGWTLVRNEDIAALREALAEQPVQQQQEPVAWMHEWEDGERIPTLHPRDARESDKPTSVRPLVYGDTSPQPAQRTWVGLTSEEKGLELLFDTHGRVLDYEDYADAIEAKLREKNT